MDIHLCIHQRRELDYGWLTLNPISCRFRILHCARGAPRRQKGVHPNVHAQKRVFTYSVDLSSCRAPSTRSLGAQSHSAPTPLKRPILTTKREARTRF